MKTLFQVKQNTARKLRSTIATFLAVIVAASTLSLPVLAAEISDSEVLHEITLTQEQLEAFEALQEFNQFTGLVGFEGDYALPNDGSLVNVIVYFQSEPAAVQIIEAAIEGYHLPITQAEQIVEDEHAAFRREIAGLFGQRGRSAGEFTINIEYRHVLSGVSLTLPANMVQAVADLPTVRAIYPDFEVSMPDPMDFEGNIVPDFFDVYNMYEDEVVYDQADYDQKDEEDYEQNDYAQEYDYDAEPEEALGLPVVTLEVNGPGWVSVSFPILGTEHEELDADEVFDAIANDELEMQEANDMFDTTADGEMDMGVLSPGIMVPAGTWIFFNAFPTPNHMVQWPYNVEANPMIYDQALLLVEEDTHVVINFLSIENAEGEATITAARRTITVSLTYGTFAQTLNPFAWEITPALGQIEQMIRVSDTEVRIVVENHAVEGGVYTITADDREFSRFYANFVNPLNIRVFDVPYMGGDSGRYRMHVEELHQRGIDGRGVLIAVIDTGIDWMHPAFAGTFPSAEFMAARGVTITQEEMINLGTDENPDWRFVGRDVARLWPGQPWRGNPTTRPAGIPGHDPMESSPLHFPNLAALPASGLSWTSHGTHVAGSIVAQNYAGHGDVGLHNFDVSALGVAPGAYAIHYRNLWGSTPGAVTLASIESAYLDRADVVNMSLGGGVFNATDGNVMAINRTVLSNPYMVFVISAGNGGPNFVTGGNPGSSTMAISVSAFAEPRHGVLLQSSYGNVVDGIATFMTPQTESFMDDTVVPGRIVLNNLAMNPVHNEDGEFKVFALPVTGSSGGNAVLPIGSGVRADFERLVEIHGREAIEGHFVLARRGSGLVEIGINAYLFGVAGIIQVTGPGQGTNSGGYMAMPQFSMHFESGLAFAQALTAPSDPIDHYGTFHFNNFYTEFDDIFLIDFSARGHVNNSFEIKPDIGAHGVATLSTNPRWSVNLPWQTDDIPWQEHWRNPDNFIGSYALSQGTSMSAPHVAGGVALMIQASTEGGSRWTAEEIRTRAMNNADPVTLYSLYGSDYEYSAFAGARQMNVPAAIDATTVVAVNYPRLAHLAGTPFRLQPHVRDIQTGSFSFGGVGVGGSSSLTASISSETGGTYYISHQFIGNSRMAVPASHRGTLIHPGTVVVPAGGSTDFIAEITIPANAPTDFVAGGATTTPPSTAGARSGNIYHEGYMIVRRGGVDGNIVARLPFGAVAIPRATGEASAEHGSNIITVTLGQVAPQTNGVFAAAASLTPARFTIGGDNAADLGAITGVQRVSNTVVNLTVSGQVRAGHYTIHADDAAFSSAFTPNVAATGGITQAHDSRLIGLATFADALPITVEGIPQVLSLVAFNNGTDTQVPSLAGNIRIWTQINGVNTPIPMSAVITAVDQDGNDAMQFVTRTRQWTTAGWQDNYVRFDVVKAGANWQTIDFTVTLNDQSVTVVLINDRFVPASPAPVFTVNAFNNGTDAQVPSLAGTIRIWTQLDGANALVPFADLTVSATLMDGTCAMEFVRINRIWNNPDYVNLIDVNKNASWPYINLSISLPGQTIDLLLINNRA